MAAAPKLGLGYLQALFNYDDGWATVQQNYRRRETTSSQRQALRATGKAQRKARQTQQRKARA